MVPRTGVRRRLQERALARLEASVCMHRGTLRWSTSTEYSAAFEYCGHTQAPTAFRSEALLSLALRDASGRQRPVSLGTVANGIWCSRPWLQRGHFGVQVGDETRASFDATRAALRAAKRCRSARICASRRA